MASKEEWQTISHLDNSHSFALSLVSEILTTCDEILFEKHISVQILPYTLDFANKLIQNLVEFYWYKRDGGVVSDEIWTADVEFEGCVTDSWATSAVPVRKIENRITPVTVKDLQEPNKLGIKIVTAKNVFQLPVPLPRTPAHIGQSKKTDTERDRTHKPKIAIAAEGLRAKTKLIG